MPAVIVPIPKGKVLVVGPIYDRIDKLSTIENIMYKYQGIIFNGSLCYPFDNLDKVSIRIHNMQHLISKHKVIYLASRLDYLLLKQLEGNGEICKWIKSLPNIAFVEFSTRRLIVLDGGLPFGTSSLSDLADNMELSFISNYNGLPWHQSYNGNMGYVISNNPLTQEYPLFYNYSMQLGNIYDKATPVYAQEVNEIGLKQTILL